MRCSDWMFLKLFSFGASLRKCVCFGVEAEFSKMFLFCLKSEFLEEFWIEKSVASVAVVQLGVFCFRQKFF